MKPYADTNFFTRFYLELPEHRATVDLLAEAAQTGARQLPVSWLHRVELTNALQLHVFAGREPDRFRVTLEQTAAVLALFTEQLEEGWFMRQVALNLESLEKQFESLCLRHTAKHGFRTYDLLHVSSALLLHCDTFWSFDPKANKLAALEGLDVFQPARRK